MKFVNFLCNILGKEELLYCTTQFFFFTEKKEQKSFYFLDYKFRLFINTCAYEITFKSSNIVV